MTITTGQSSPSSSNAYTPQTPSIVLALRGKRNTATMSLSKQTIVDFNTSDTDITTTLRAAADTLIPPMKRLKETSEGSQGSFDRLKPAAFANTLDFLQDVTQDNKFTLLQKFDSAQVGLNELLLRYHTLDISASISDLRAWFEGPQRHLPLRRVVDEPLRLLREDFLTKTGSPFNPISTHRPPFNSPIATLWHEIADLNPLEQYLSPDLRLRQGSTAARLVAINAMRTIKGFAESLANSDDTVDIDPLTSALVAEQFALQQDILADQTATEARSALRRQRQ